MKRTLAALATGIVALGIVTTGAGAASAHPTAPGTPPGTNASDTSFTICPQGPVVPGEFGSLSVDVSAAAQAGIAPRRSHAEMPTPTGTVSFAVISGPNHHGEGGTHMLVGGSADSDNIDFDEDGEYVVTASYSGDSFYASSDNSCDVFVQSEDSLTVTSTSPIDPGTGNPTSVFGQAVTFTVTLNVPPSSDVRVAHVRPAGVDCAREQARPAAAPAPDNCAELSVETYDAAGDEYNQPIALTDHTSDGEGDHYSGSQEFDNLPIGSHEVDAFYTAATSATRQRLAPRLKQESLSDSLEQDVISGETGPSKRPTKTVLTSSANPSDSGAPVTFTATVTPADGGGGTPTGTVVFAADGVNHPETLSGGVATFEDDALTDGAHEVDATYTGDSTFSSSADHLLQMVGSGGTGPGGLSGLLFTEPGTSALGLITVGGASQNLPLRNGSGPSSLAIGSDARVWVVEAGKDAIAAVDTTGHETDFALPTDAFPTSIVAGSDGRLWFTEPGLHRIAAITTSGTITNYPLGKHAEPFELAAGPHGKVWFTEPDRGRIGRIRANGHHKTFAVRAGSKPLGITAGPDGALWFTEANKRRIGRITTAGAATDVKVAKHSKPSAIVTGPDGALWFTEPGLSRIGRITVGGAVTSFAARAGGKPSAITVGPDSRLWFTEPGSNRIGAMTAAGAFTDYSVAAGSNPSAIISLS